LSVANRFAARQIRTQRAIFSTKFLINTASLSARECNGFDEDLDCIDLGEDNDEMDGEWLSATRAGNGKAVAANGCILCCTFGLSGPSLSPSVKPYSELSMTVDWSCGKAEYKLAISGVSSWKRTRA
jgi:hypothetical protein